MTSEVLVDDLQTVIFWKTATCPSDAGKSAVHGDTATIAVYTYRACFRN